MIQIIGVSVFHTMLSFFWIHTFFKPTSLHLHLAFLSFHNFLSLTLYPCSNQGLFTLEEQTFRKKLQIGLFLHQIRILLPQLFLFEGSPLSFVPLVVITLPCYFGLCLYSKLLLVGWKRWVLAAGNKRRIWCFKYQMHMRHYPLSKGIFIFFIILFYII